MSLPAVQCVSRVRRHLVGLNRKKTQCTTARTNLWRAASSKSVSSAVTIREPPSKLDGEMSYLVGKYGLKTCSVVVERLSNKKLDILRKIAEVKRVLENLSKKQLPKQKRLEMELQGGSMDPLVATKEILCHVNNCGFKGKFTSHFELDMHLRRHHEGVKKPYSCQLCSKSFQTLRYLDDHMNGHNGEKPYVCSTCGARRGTRSLLKRHQRLVHGAQTRKRSFRCQVCRARFESRMLCVDHEGTHPEMAHLRRGQGRNKSGDKEKKDRPVRARFECDLCGFRGKYHSVFKQHMMRHSDVRPVQCEVCDRSFKRLSALTVHMAVHTDERPFPCHLCSKTFKLKKTLANHVLLHSGDRPFKCHICPKAYPTNTHLAMHMLSHKKKGDFVPVSSPSHLPPSVEVQRPDDPHPTPDSATQRRPCPTVDVSQLFSQT